MRHKEKNVWARKTFQLIDFGGQDSALTLSNPFLKFHKKSTSNEWYREKVEKKKEEKTTQSADDQSLGSFFFG